MSFEFIFWCSISMLVYVYIGYPCIAYLLSQWFGRPVCKQDIEPSVSVVISAYNEQDCIEATVENKLEQDYPPDKLEILVVSDSSSDNTDQQIKCMSNLCSRYPERVRLLRQEPRAGKTSALNMAIDEAHGEIIVFSDANSMYSENAIRLLARNFADPAVGYVTGSMVYVNKEQSATAEGCSSYMRYENFLRGQETGVGSVVGVNGGIDAIRKEQFSPMRADQLPDFVLPLNIVSQGYRVVYEPSAILREPALERGDDEYRMRIRVSLRALWALWDMRHLFNVFRYGFFSVQLLSHKLLRYAVFLFLIGAAASNLALITDSTLYQFTLFAQVGFYALAIRGYMKSRAGERSRIGYMPYYFMLLNLASAQAFGKFVAGKKQVIWEPRTG
jgi:cellulose synthase/poly-beta-1,6-N-acetylglucosamine synthase-like glycosyltransferase